jgi:hypothetical protein
MRPLNRPMFKMGGPVKEGIMDGIREPKANGGTIGGGTIVGEDKGKGRTGFFNPLALIPAGITALRAAGPAAARGFQAARTFKPGKLGFVDRTKDIFSVRGGLSAPMAGSRAEGLGFRLGSFARQNPFLTLSTPSLATTAVTAGGPAVLGAGKAIANFLVPGERFDPFKPEKPEEIVKKSNVGQVGKKGGDAVTPKDKDATNQFNDDGTKKDTSVERLLKGVVTRARRDAGADTAIEVGRQLRTGEMSIKDPSGAIDVASQKFDKVSDLQSKVDLARIENELKKQQIKEQALATDKYIRAASATGKPVDFVARKSLGIPTSISETVAIFEKAQPGVTKTNEGTQIVAKEWADTEGINFQGSLGGDDDLKKANKIEEFKLNPESFILEKIEELDGNNGLYVFGTNVFEYNNGVVKKIKN